MGESNDHQMLHEDYEEGLNQEMVENWRIELQEWEDNHEKPNPFEKRYRGMCFYDWCLLL